MGLPQINVNCFEICEMKKAFDNPSCIGKRLCRVTAIAILAVTCGCATEGTKAKHLTEAEVIAIADRVAVKSGCYSLDKFTRYARYNLVVKDNTWIVFYDLKPDAHGMVPVGG